MSSDSGATTSLESVDIGPTDTFDIIGPARGRTPSARRSIIVTTVALVCLGIVIALWGFLFLPMAVGLGVVAVLVERSYLRQPLRLQLTYDFLRLPDQSVHSWQNISDLELAADGQTLLIWVFATPSVRGERSESDPVREQPVSVSLRGWPYPPDEIVATLVGQFEKYLDEVAVDDDPGSELPLDFGDSVLTGLRVTQDFVDERPRQESSALTERALADLVRSLPGGSRLVLRRGGGDPSCFLQVRAEDGAAFKIEHRDVGAQLYRADTGNWHLACRIALGWAKDAEDWRDMIRWEPFSLK